MITNAKASLQEFEKYELDPGLLAEGIDIAYSMRECKVQTCVQLTTRGAFSLCVRDAYCMDGPRRGTPVHAGAAGLLRKPRSERGGGHVVLPQAGHAHYVLHRGYVQPVECVCLCVPAGVWMHHVSLQLRAGSSPCLFFCVVPFLVRMVCLCCSCC